MNQPTKFHVSYLNKVAKELRAKAKKETRARGFEPLFERGNSYSVGTNSNGDPFVQINYTVNGSAQCDNYAI